MQGTHLWCFFRKLLYVVLPKIALTGIVACLYIRRRLVLGHGDEDCWGSCCACASDGGGLHALPDFLKRLFELGSTFRSSSEGGGGGRHPTDEVVEGDESHVARLDRRSEHDFMGLQRFSFMRLQVGSRHPS